MAVYEAPVVVDDSRPPYPDYYLAHLHALLAADHRGDAVELFLTVAAGVPAGDVASLRETPLWPGFEAVAPTLAYDSAILAGTVSGGPLPADRWAAVTVPVLVLVADGAASPAWMHHAAEALAAVLPDTRRRTLDGQDHAVAPEVLAPVLTQFYAGPR